eukprot:COSAG06_NODE_16628_length_990_cov_0.870932_1_plen_55_part_00
MTWRRSAAGRAHCELTGLGMAAWVCGLRAAKQGRAAAEAGAKVKPERGRRCASW